MTHGVLNKVSCRAPGGRSSMCELDKLQMSQGSNVRYDSWSIAAKWLKSAWFLVLDVSDLR